MKFNKREVKELIKAWFFISLAFAVLFSGGFKIFSAGFSFLLNFIISAFTVGIAFLFHEIMHKAIAQKYGYWAEFRAFNKMLWLALFFSFFGFIIAAPGGVMIKGFMSKERNGKISLAGPLTNVVLAFLFLIPFLFFQFSGLLGTFLGFGFRINSLLALFNLLPIPGFDGRKVLVWSKAVYLSVAIAALLLFVIGFYLV